MVSPELPGRLGCFGRRSKSLRWSFGDEQDAAREVRFSSERWLVTNSSGR